MTRSTRSAIIRPVRAFVAARLYRYFVGESPSDARTDELAAVFRKGGLEIKPLVQNILEGRDFANARHSRAAHTGRVVDSRARDHRQHQTHGAVRHRPAVVRRTRTDAVSPTQCCGLAPRRAMALGGADVDPHQPVGTTPSRQDRRRPRRAERRRRTRAIAGSTTSRRQLVPRCSGRSKNRPNSPRASSCWSPSRSSHRSSRSYEPSSKEVQPSRSDRHARRGRGRRRQLRHVVPVRPPWVAHGRGRDEADAGDRPVRDHKPVVAGDKAVARW